MANHNAVIEAVQSGKMDVLRDLLSHDPALASSRDPMGISALMHAVYRGRSDAVELLRASPIALDVFEAAALGDMPRLAALLQQDPSLANAWGADGFTPLHLAAYFAQPAAALFLLQQGANPAAVAQNPTGVMPLHSAASARNVATVRDLLAHGAPVNPRQQQGWTPLHSAAQNGHEELVALLLHHGADPALKNDDGVTPSDVAAKSGHPALAQRLVPPA
jgi:ankyrin repeat protein